MESNHAAVLIRDGLSTRKMGAVCALPKSRTLRFWIRKPKRFLHRACYTYYSRLMPVCGNRKRGYVERLGCNGYRVLYWAGRGWVDRGWSIGLSSVVFLGPWFGLPPFLPHLMTFRGSRGQGEGKERHWEHSTDGWAPIKAVCIGF